MIPYYVGLTLILILLTVILSAYLYMKFLKRKRLLYAVDESIRVKLSKNITYKKVHDKKLLMDIYSPEKSSKKSKLPVVIFVHGEGPEIFIKDAKNWGIYSDYGRLLASKGFVAVTFNHRYAGAKFKNVEASSGDVLAAVQYVKDNADTWNIDAEKICIWAFSMGGIYSTMFLNEDNIKIKSLISYYGLLEINDKAFKNFAAEKYLESYKNNISILIVKSAKDRIKAVNESIDNFVKAAKKYNIQYKYIVHSTGGHSFDVFKDNAETRKIIEETIGYMESSLM